MNSRDAPGKDAHFYPDLETIAKLAREIRIQKPVKVDESQVGDWLQVIAQPRPGWVIVGNGCYRKVRKRAGN